MLRTLLSVGCAIVFISTWTIVHAAQDFDPDSTARAKDLIGRAQTLSIASPGGVSDASDSLSPGDYFAASYADSRSRFRESCEQSLSRYPGGFCRSYRISSKVDPDLTVDYGFFTKHGSRLVLIESGIHGPEGYAGSAAQQLMFRKYLGRFLDQGIDVFFIHALNPYGFKYNRRTDEFNVNLNRNFSVDESIFRGKNANYEKIESLMEPQGKIWNYALSSRQIQVGFYAEYARLGGDKQPIIDGMNSGQYESENGLNYGGGTHEQQTAFLKEQLTPILRQYEGNVLFLDFHTGLGENGVLHVMSGNSPSAEMLAQIKSLLAPLAAEGVEYTNSSESGFYADTGDVIDFVPSLSPTPSKVLALTLEYGTMGTGASEQIDTAARMILENQAHFYGCYWETDCRKIEKDFADLFNPPDAQWRAKVVKEADRVFSALADQF